MINLILSGLFIMPIFGKYPVIGEPAPKFSLYDQDGELHSLDDYKDKKLVVYFFPKADTPVSYTHLTLPTICSV